MTRPTEAKADDLTHRTQAYIDRLHTFAQEEADRAKLPANIAIPALVAWALSVASMAGVTMIPVNLEADEADEPDANDSIH